MKIITYIILLSLSHITQASQPEWQFYIPSESANISGVYVDHNEALVISQIDDQTPEISTFVFDNEFPLDIGDNIGITGFVIKETQTNDISYSMSLSSSTNTFETDDVIECINGICNSILDLSENFSLKANNGISALNWINNGSLLEISTDIGLNSLSNYISPCGSYRHAIGSNFLLPVLNINNLENCSINALSKTFFVRDGVGEDVFYFSLNTIYSNTDSVVYPSEVHSLDTTSHQNIFTEELFNKVSNIQAYDALDTGWIEFANNSLQVNESAGTLSFTVKRVEGFEFSISSFADTSSGTALNGTDYSFTEVSPQWNQYENADQTFIITIFDNNIADGNKMFTINLSTPSEWALINPLKNQITVTIVDDESDLIFMNGFE